MGNFFKINNPNPLEHSPKDSPDPSPQNSPKHSAKQSPKQPPTVKSSHPFAKQPIPHTTTLSLSLYSFLISLLRKIVLRHKNKKWNLDLNLTENTIGYPCSV